MKIEALTSSDIELAAGWLSRKENSQWLDFGQGHQALSLVSLKAMTQRDIHLIRVFTSNDDDRPIGLVALSDVNRLFKTARLWYVLGEKDHSGQGYTARAVLGLLSTAFTQMELGSVNAWAVEGNVPSIRILERNGFRFVGRQRESHVIDGRPCDRLLFDILAREYRASRPSPSVISRGFEL